MRNMKNMKNIELDYFENAYISGGEFINDLRTLVDAQEWVDVTIKEMRIQDLPNMPMLIHTNDLNLDNVRVKDLGVITETMRNMGLLLETPKETFLMRSCSYNSLLDRSRISGGSIHRIYTEQRQRFIEHINLYLSLYSDKAKCLIRKGRIAALLSQDYRILNQLVLFEKAFEIISKRFDGYQFIDGVITEEYSSCLVELQASRELFNPIEKFLKKIGVTQVIPLIRITTSDLGTSSACMTPMLKTNNERLIGYGNKLKINHTGKCNEDDFADLVDVIFPQFLETVKRIQSLEKETFYYPTQVYLNLCKKFRIPINLATKGAENMKKIEGIGAINGADLYYYLCDLLDLAKIDKKSETELIVIEESIGRALLYKGWKSLDYPLILK